MIRAQIQFEEKQYEEIRILAHGRRSSIAETVRLLLRAGLRAELGDEPPGPQAEALLALAGIGKSGLGDLGRRHDEYLAEDFAR